MKPNTETENPDCRATGGRVHPLVRLLQDAENYMSTLAPHMIDRQGPTITRQLIGELAKARDAMEKSRVIIETLRESLLVGLLTEKDPENVRMLTEILDEIDPDGVEMRSHFLMPNVKFNRASQKPNQKNNGK